MTMIDADTLRLVEAAVRLGAVIWQWLTDEAHEQPISASMTALVLLIDTRPAVRAELVDRCNANAVLRQQLLDLCDAYRDHFPPLVTLEKEISHATR